MGYGVDRASCHYSVMSVPSVACIKILSSPHPILTLLHFPAAPYSPLTCAAFPPLNRPPISGTADRAWVLMRRAWVGKWCVRAVASGVGDCCRWGAWLLKYIICEIVSGCRQSASICSSYRIAVQPPFLLTLPRRPPFSTHLRCPSSTRRTAHP